MCRFASAVSLISNFVEMSSDIFAHATFTNLSTSFQFATWSKISQTVPVGIKAHHIDRAEHPNFSCLAEHVFEAASLVSTNQRLVTVPSPQVTIRRVSGTIAHRTSIYHWVPAD